jgi:hypothetical protein
MASTPNIRGSSTGSSALAYTNNRGVTYYLHAGKTKTGKPRYFVAKEEGEGALAAMPAGLEFSESINGVVSVRRIDESAPTVPAEDLDLVRAELARHAHLRFHRADVVKGEIVVFQPEGGLTVETAAMAGSLGLMLGLHDDRLAGRLGRSRYEAVLKFIPLGDGDYEMRRMTYRGDGGWSWPLSHGPLKKLVSKHVRLVGTDAFFELL